MLHLAPFGNDSQFRLEWSYGAGLLESPDRRGPATIKDNTETFI